MWYVYRLTSKAARGAVLSAAILAASAPTAWAQSTGVAGDGRVSLDIPDLPPATVELDLGQGLIRHSLSLCDATLAGFLEGLMTSPSAESSENARFVTEQLTSARELGDAVSEVLHEVHVRVWDNLPSESRVAEQVFDHLDTNMSSAGWESAVRVRDGHSTVRVFVQRSENSLNGLLIVAAEGNDLVVTNLIGDLSPEKVQRVSATATKIGVKLGLDKEINRAVEQLRHEIENSGHRR